MTEEIDEILMIYRDYHNKTKISIKQLASNVAKALSKKVSVDELKGQIQDEFKQQTPVMLSQLFSQIPSKKSDRRNVSRGRDPNALGGKENAEEQENSSDYYHYHYYSDEDSENIPPGNRSRNIKSSSNVHTSTTMQTNKLHRAYDELKLEVNTLLNTIHTLKSHQDELKNCVDKELLNVRNNVETRLASYENIARIEKNSNAQVIMNDWRIALGECSMNLRRELSDKMGREEVVAYVRDELSLLDKKLVVSIRT